jgi:hypothetical protein
MERRGFLGALMGLAAAPVLARIPLAVEVPRRAVFNQPIAILPTLAGAGMVVQATLVGIDHYSARGNGRLLRGDDTVC